MEVTQLQQLRAEEKGFGLAQRWLRFTRERFDPVSHLLMISLFFAAHLLVAGRVAGDAASPGRVGAGTLAPLFVGTLSFFFKLRLYDEIKDYEVDLEFNPWRPLARGLLARENVFRGILLCIIVELASFLVLGMPALLGMGLAISYSLLMFKEFFIGRYLRPHLTTYAVSHTVVSSILSLALFSALAGVPPWALETDFYLFALNSWCLFNIFEFGRKTFLSGEERDRVESYSKIFGRYGAVGLVLAMAGASAHLLFRLSWAASPGFRISLGALMVLLGALGLGYAVLDRAPFGKLYRGVSSVYIVLAYLGILLGAGGVF